MRVFNPAKWEVPRVSRVTRAGVDRGSRDDMGAPAERPLRPPRLPGCSGDRRPGLDPDRWSSRIRRTNSGTLLKVLSPDDWWKFRDDINAELERRRVLIEPFEASLFDLLASLFSTHWALAIIQLHEFGLIDAIPLPAPSPAAIPVLDLTGYYTSLTDATGYPIAAMQINQAGDELRGFWVDDLLEIWPITGRFDAAAQANGAFRWTLTSTFDGSSGSISLREFPTTDPTALVCDLDWATDSVPWRMARRDRRARVNPTAIVAQLGQSAGAVFARTADAPHPSNSSRPHRPARRPALRTDLRCIQRPRCLVARRGDGQLGRHDGHRQGPRRAERRWFIRDDAAARPRSG